MFRKNQRKLSEKYTFITLVGVEPDWPGQVPFYNRVSSLAELTQPSDLAILAGDYSIPIEQVVAECGNAGIKYLLMLTWADEPLASLHAALREYGVRLLGPNSFGVCRPKLGLFAWLGLAQPRPGRLALLSQSGTVASALVDWATWQGIGFSQVVAMGEQIDEVMPSQILVF